jgi:hypothetical protein
MTECPHSLATVKMAAQQFQQSKALLVDIRRLRNPLLRLKARDFNHPRYGPLTSLEALSHQPKLPGRSLADRVTASYQAASLQMRLEWRIER